MIRLTKQFSGYSWTYILEGIKKREGHLHSIGWYWASGHKCHGVWYTKSESVASQASAAFGVEIEDITEELKSKEYRMAV